MNLTQREVDQLLSDYKKIECILEIYPDVNRKDLEALTSGELHDVFRYYSQHRGAE